MKNIPALAEGATNSEKVIHIIATAYATEDKSVIDRIESILLPDDISLNDELTEMLNSTGNNPIEEPELYKILEARDYDEFKKLCIKNRDIDSIDTYDLQDLSVAISKKITSLTDDRGAFKSTENTKELKLPKSSELIELNRIITTKEDQNINIEKLIKEIMKISNLDEEKITEWEKSLVCEIYFTFIRGVNDSTAQRQAVDRSPFARYLKN